MTDDNDLPIFRPRMGKRTRPSGGAHASFRNALLSRLRAAGRRGERRLPARSRLGAGPPGPDARRVTVKAHFTRLTPSGAKAASLHLHYIERDGVAKDGSKGVLYGPDGAELVETFEQPRPGEKHQFRVIISPEDAEELDLTALVRTLMARVERDLGRKLEWAAVNHYNTEHPHSHVVIRGVDRRGRELRFDRDYISNGVRWRAQEIATRELGPRPEQDIQRTFRREVTQERFTALDRELERRAEHGRVQLSARERRGRIEQATLLARLEHLEGLRLAERVASWEWSLPAGWQHRLQELGERGDILKQIHRAISGDPARYHIVRPGQLLPTEPADVRSVITGRVAGKGLSDELKGTFYAVIEAPGGSAYHVALDARSVETLRVGDIVSMTTKPAPAIRPIDRHIARVDENQGVYEPNRLRELDRRDGDAPARQRLLLHKEALSLSEQVRNPGPVWLDRIAPSSVALYGFGAEILNAIERRRSALRHIGIADDEPNKLAKLRELERRSLAKQVAESSRQFPLQSIPDGFRGRILDARRSPTGTSYSVISDGQRFVLMRTNASLRRLAGKTVTVSRDAKGGLTARETRDLGLER